MPSLLQLLQEAEIYILKRTKDSKIINVNGIEDPCGNEVVIDPWFRGGLLKGTDGKLHVPTGTLGYTKTKTTQLNPSANRRSVTNGATPVALVNGAAGGTTHTQPLTAYQSSGADLALSLTDGGGTVVFQQTIPTGVVTVLTIPQPAIASNWYAVWAGAAGATNYVGVIDHIPVAHVDVT